MSRPAPHHAPGDLTQRPLDYPLAPVAGPRLLVDDLAHTLRLRRLRTLVRLLEEHRAAPLADRTPVLAVGSNAASEVLAHKLRRHGAPAVVPLLTGVVRNLAVAHTAYVSHGGYVPATPSHRTGVRTPVVLQLLDDQQLGAVDATEPGYDRVELGARRYPLLVVGGFRPTRFHVYAAHAGVLDLPGHGRRFLTQAEVLGALQEAGLPHTGSGEPAAVAARLAGSAARRHDVRGALARRGMVRGSGLVARPAGALRWTQVVSPAAGRSRSRP